MNRVLVIDDAPTIRHAMADHLRALVPGLEIEEAEDAEQGLALAKAGEHDLVFLDGAFRDGTPSAELLAKILDARPRARVVLTTARPREDPRVVESLGIGAYAFLAKPVRREALEDILLRVSTDEGRVGRIR